jgi:tRNA(Arg) A34 adenosine deaminase TadA
MKPIKSLRLALVLQYQGQDSFKGCHLKTHFPSNALLLSALLVLSMAVLAQISVRPGIILLLLPDSILSSKAASAGQAVAAGLVQNIPLAEGSTSKTGNTTVGRTIELNATADATGATTAYRIDEFTAYKKHSPIPICSRSVHSSKNAVAVQASQSRQGDCTPQRPRLQARSWAALWPSRNSAGFLAITLPPDAIVERARRMIGEPTSALH